MITRYANADKILTGMTVWLTYGHREKKRPAHDKRTEVEAAWDSAILAAAEYVRRLTNYDESLAFTIHDLLTKESLKYFREDGKAVPCGQ